MAAKITGWMLMMIAAMILVPDHALEISATLIAMAKLCLRLVLYSAGDRMTTASKTAEQQP